mmetsp:Transcript_25498/g.64001  ORF Transcript_25498/g.64001 Transcript_25498/m.64001 type:complete len:997 (+) Transcript_25498:196-3186(+)
MAAVMDALPVRLRRTLSFGSKDEIIFQKQRVNIQQHPQFQEKTYLHPQLNIKAKTSLTDALQLETSGNDSFLKFTCKLDEECRRRSKTFTPPVVEKPAVQAREETVEDLPVRNWGDEPQVSTPDLASGQPLTYSYDNTSNLYLIQSSSESTPLPYNMLDSYDRPLYKTDDLAQSPNLSYLLKQDEQISLPFGKSEQTQKKRMEKPLKDSYTPSNYDNPYATHSGMYSPFTRAEDAQSQSPSKPLKGVDASSHGKNWTSELIDLVMMKDTLHKFKRLSQLANDFNYAASAYTKIIVSEYCLPYEQKTIKPVAIGGVAGGSKYIVQGILFKFALDAALAPGVWMYGGNRRSDEDAIHAASNELRGLEAMWSRYLPDLHFPLMTIVDYKGFRVVAVSVLPLDNTTLIYGSNDAGRTVHADVPEFNELMKTVGNALFLEEHHVGKHRHATVFGPGDIEGHLGLDGRFYALDFARLSPPEAPSQDPEVRKSKPRTVFYQLLRFEFLMKYGAVTGKRLCSDAFTAWDTTDYTEAKRHAENVREATDYLYNVVIPDFARDLVANGDVGDYMSGSFKSMQQAMGLVANHAVHVSGINMRHLGRIRSNVTCPKIRHLLLVACLARTLKSIIFEQMRERMQELNVPTNTPFQEVVSSHLMFLLGYKPKCDGGDCKDGGDKNSDKNTLVDTKIASKFAAGPLSVAHTTKDVKDDSGSDGKSHNIVFSCSQDYARSSYWKMLKVRMMDKFLCVLSKDEVASDYLLYDKVDIRLLIFYLLDICHIRLSRPARQELAVPTPRLPPHPVTKELVFEPPMNIIFVEEDVKSLKARAKYLYCMLYAVGMGQLLLAKSRNVEKVEFRPKLRLLKRARETLLQVHRQIPLCPLILAHMGEAIFEEAVLLSKCHNEDSALLKKMCTRFEKAQGEFERAMEAVRKVGCMPAILEGLYTSCLETHIGCCEGTCTEGDGHVELLKKQIVELKGEVGSEKIKSVTCSKDWSLISGRGKKQ